MRIGWVLPLLVASVLAGCSDQGGAGTTDDPLDVDVDVQPTATTGIIRGVVVDNAIRPVSGVSISVAVPQGAPKTFITGETGAFGFEGLEPGTYFLKAHKVGYFDVQQSADVVAGVDDPPVVKMLLQIDVKGIPFAVAFQWEGFVECGTNVVALCAVPNAINQTACSQTGICTPPLTNDDFDEWYLIEGTPEFIQSEMYWDSTQTASTTFSLLLRAAEKADYDSGFYEFSVNSTEGESPITVTADAGDIEDAELGNRTGLMTSVFSGSIDGTEDLPPFGGPGFVLEQRFTVITHVFYAYRPPSDWRFVETGSVPPPE